MFIKSVTPRGFLSFPRDAPPLELRRGLNVLIGANGSGKSNLFEALRFIQAAGTERSPLAHYLIRESSVLEWVWKGNDNTQASVEIVMADDARKIPLRYRVGFQHDSGRARLVDERLEDERATRKGKPPNIYIARVEGGVYLDRRERRLTPEQVSTEATVLGTFNTEADYPDNAWMTVALRSLQFFSDPLFGRGSEIRKAQSTGLPRSLLDERGFNLPLVLNRVLQVPGMRARMASLAKEVYPHVDEVSTDVADNRIQVLFIEGSMRTPAIRLSDGTMRWVFLLTLLLDPANRGPVFLDEPDLGLHPDALKCLATLLKEASERTQIVVATHNVTLLDYLSDEPEAVVVFENVASELSSGSHATRYSRLGRDSVPIDMRLGEAWQRGFIGGNRW